MTSFCIVHLACKALWISLTVSGSVNWPNKKLQSQFFFMTSDRENPVNLQNPSLAYTMGLSRIWAFARTNIESVTRKTTSFNDNFHLRARFSRLKLLGISVVSIENLNNLSQQGRSNSKSLWNNLFKGGTRGSCHGRRVPLMPLFGSFVSYYTILSSEGTMLIKKS